MGGVGRDMLNGRGGGQNVVDHSSHDFKEIEKGSIGLILVDELIGLKPLGEEFDCEGDPEGDGNDPIPYFGTGPRSLCDLFIDFDIFRC